MKKQKNQEPIWRKTSRISEWKNNQPFWVVVCSGVSENCGYVQQVNVAFGVIQCTKDAKLAVKYRMTDAYATAKTIESFGIHRTHIEYTGPKHPEE